MYKCTLKQLKMCSCKLDPIMKWSISTCQFVTITPYQNLPANSSKLAPQVVNTVGIHWVTSFDKGTLG